MTLVTMTTDLIAHAHGDPVASADAAAIAVFVHQSPAGSRRIGQQRPAARISMVRSASNRY